MHSAELTGDNEEWYFPHRTAEPDSTNESEVEWLTGDTKLNQSKKRSAWRLTNDNASASQTGDTSFSWFKKSSVWRSTSEKGDTLPN